MLQTVHNGVRAPADTIHTQFLEKYMADAIDTQAYAEQADLDTDWKAGQLEMALSAQSHWVAVIEKGADLVMIGPRLSGGCLVKASAPSFVRMTKTSPQCSATRSTAEGKLKELVQVWFGYDASC